MVTFSYLHLPTLISVCVVMYRCRRHFSNPGIDQGPQGGGADAAAAELRPHAQEPVGPQRAARGVLRVERSARHSRTAAAGQHVS